MTADEIHNLVNQCAERTKASVNPLVAAGTMQMANIMIQAEIAIRLGEIAEQLAHLSRVKDVLAGIAPLGDIAEQLKNIDERIQARV